MKEMTAQALKPLLTDGAEIAFLDVREHGQYGEGHPFFSVHLPYSKIEVLAPKLMPCRAVRCVLMDDGDGVGARAAAVLEDLGYNNVAVLSGGAPAWAAAGYTLFKGVNVPSKAFGELVEHAFQTPAISAEELNSLQQLDKDLLVLDGRSSPEFRKMSLPRALSCPNAELGYRLPMLNSDPTTPIVVNCAGRTRSIIGAQTLSLLGVPNPVYALRNGSQGWRLAGFDLRHGVEPLPLPQPDPEALAAGSAKAAELREDYGLPVISGEQAQSWLSAPDQTTYLFDVRSKQEYAEGHVAGARSAPGGQLVQATDEQLAVRNARILLCCDNGLRSATTAIWLTGMGHRVWLLDTATARTETREAVPVYPGLADSIDLAGLKTLVDAGALVLDASRGLDYRAGHIDGAVWTTRARVNSSLIGDPDGIVLTGRCPVLMAGVAAEIKSLTGQPPKNMIQGNPASWRSAGLRVVETPQFPSEADCIDYLFFVHDRHDGNLDAARRYLEWELGLLDQLDEQEHAVLNPLRPRVVSERLENAARD
ncbi:rhodanese-like domain-containing protein [Denitrobaculum tricleocarpae]|uniref:Sulfurtransferase n=1 Tax=Denitrobaculum tricleocarpae TaxID=2591009 RepID=A0A545TX88_9PROT|nr:rhodanese-like domain-containing protein [Denitrobaculum tricleocarpae]TQV81794.1 sulfurtransferase [Denitrobaculum tricleocarpae]